MSTLIGQPRLPSPALEPVSDEQKRFVRMACSLLLDYPDEKTAEELAAVRAGLDDLPAPVAERLRAFCDAAEKMSLRELEIAYVETFDQRRRCTLGLTYYTHGDTRSRGQAIIGFKEALKRSGFEVEREELPDHLPLLLEFAALDDSGVAESLLEANREGIEVVRSALRSYASPWAELLEALVLTLPEATPEVVAAYQRLISQGPPTELVGIGDLHSTPSPLLVSER